MQSLVRSMPDLHKTLILANIVPATKKETTASTTTTGIIDYSKWDNLDSDDSDNSDNDDQQQEEEEGSSKKSKNGDNSDNERQEYSQQQTPFFHQYFSQGCYACWL